MGKCTIAKWDFIFGPYGLTYAGHMYGYSNEVCTHRTMCNNYKYSHAYPVVECFNGKASHKMCVKYVYLCTTKLKMKYPNKTLDHHIS